MIRFFTFTMYHNKPMAGSTFIRVMQLIKYWPQAALYKYGENPDALIFQKVYTAPDYKFLKHFENIKILDCCDPDWFDGVSIVEACQAVDAITTSTQALADFLGQFGTPTYFVPDRWDIEDVPKLRKHEGKAKTVLWFGYAHNAELLKPALPLLQELGLKLILVANDDPILYRFSPRKDNWYRFVKYPEDSKEFYELLRQADFAILPKGNRPEDRFKSDNKTTKSILGGLPVADDEDSVRRFMSARERNKFMLENYDRIKRDYDVKESVKDLQRIIKECKVRRQKANA